MEICFVLDTKIKNIKLFYQELIDGRGAIRTNHKPALH